MKPSVYILILSVFSLSTISAFAQEKTIGNGFSLHFFNPSTQYEFEETYYYFPSREKSRSYGVELGSYFSIGKNQLIRIRVGYSKIENYKEVDYIIDNDTWFDRLTFSKNQNHFHISPGIFSYLKFNKFQVTGGFEIPINFHQSFYRNFQVIHFSEPNNGSLVRTEKYTYKGGTSIGIAGIFGFNYYFINQISLDAEIRNSILYSNIGGDVEINEDGDITTFSQEISGISYINPTFSIGVTFWILN